MSDIGWRAMLPADPLPWLLESAEPAARWVALVELLDRPPGDREVRAAHDAVLADEGTRELLARLPDWERPQQISGHDAPAFAPNLLHLLADTGVAEADDARIRRLLDTMLEHVDDEGRFATCGTLRGDGRAALGRPPLRHPRDRRRARALRAGRGPARGAGPRSRGRRPRGHGPGSRLAVPPGRRGRLPRSRSQGRLLPARHPRGPARLLAAGRGRASAPAWSMSPASRCAPGGSGAARSRTSSATASSSRR